MEWTTSRETEVEVMNVDGVIHHKLDGREFW